MSNQLSQIRKASRWERPLHVAVTGHRNLRDASTATFVTRAIQTILGQLASEHPAGLRALSGLAEGADTIFAEQALSLGLSLEVIIAAEDLSETFLPGEARTHFLELLDRSSVQHKLPFTHSGPTAYAALGRALVERADLLVAVWDGRPAPDDGGTGGVVALARKRCLPIIHIHTLHHTITRDPVTGPSAHDSRRRQAPA